VCEACADRESDRHCHNQRNETILGHVEMSSYRRFGTISRSRAIPLANMAADTTVRISPGLAPAALDPERQR
jgi:hypothetical protein